jgi:PleD family two-component response regulator
MPGIDGFAVLKNMQESAELQHIPVIAVSGAEDQATIIRAIRAGATDFGKPADPEPLRVRVRVAVSQAENEKLRVLNSLLAHQNSKTARYKALLEQHGIEINQLLSSQYRRKERYQ